jgi:hypothetical protein
MTEVTEKRQKHNYIDNKEFYLALLDRREQIDIALLEQVKDEPDEYKRRFDIIEFAKTDAEINKARKKGDTTEHFKLVKQVKKNKTLKFPQVSNYIGSCFIKIAENFAKIQNSKHSYARYTFKDEMIQDAIYNCLHYIDNFDARRGKNPFCFFTTCVWHSFVHRIHEERKELATKQKMIKNFDVDKISVQGHDNVDMVNEYIDQIKSYLTGVDYSEYYDNKKEEINKTMNKRERIPKELRNSLLDFLCTQDDSSIDIITEESFELI